MWKSPLRVGQIVETNDGYTVRILEDPELLSDSYVVPIQDLSSKKKSVWGHSGPNVFLTSFIKKIDGQIFGGLLEEEFFSR